MYTRKHALERHVAYAHHGEMATFRCEFCSFRALDRANFRQHMSRHFHLKNFACEVSNYCYFIQRKRQEVT